MTTALVFHALSAWELETSCGASPASHHSQPAAPGFQQCDAIYLQGHLIGHIKDIGHDPANPITRLYATSAAQPYHNDSGARCCASLSAAPRDSKLRGCTSRSCMVLHGTVTRAAHGALLESSGSPYACCRHWWWLLLQQALILHMIRIGPCCSLMAAHSATTPALHANLALSTPQTTAHAVGTQADMPLLPQSCHRMSPAASLMCHLLPH
jgi:hypothetical protein